MFQNIFDVTVSAAVYFSGYSFFSLYFNSVVVLLYFFQFQSRPMILWIPCEFHCSLIKACSLCKGTCKWQTVLETLKTPKAYSEPSQTSKIEPFAKIVYGFQLLTIFAKRSILDFWLGSEYAFKLKDVIRALPNSTMESFNENNFSQKRSIIDTSQELGRTDSLRL